MTWDICSLDYGNSTIIGCLTLQPQVEPQIRPPRDLFSHSNLTSVTDISRVLPNRTLLWGFLGVWGQGWATGGAENISHGIHLTLEISFCWKQRHKWLRIWAGTTPSRKSSWCHSDTWQVTTLGKTPGTTASRTQSGWWIKKITQEWKFMDSQEEGAGIIHVLID